MFFLGCLCCSSCQFSVLCFFGLFWDGRGGGSMLLILLVFCVVLLCLFIGGVYVAHPVSFQCCGFFGEGWGVYVAHLVGFLCCLFGGSMLLILLVFCVFLGSMLLILLVFCVVCCFFF